MADRTNVHGQPIGPEVADWSTRPSPSREPMVGRFCRLEIADPALHAGDLWEALSEEEVERLKVFAELTCSQYAAECKMTIPVRPSRPAR